MTWAQSEAPRDEVVNRLRYDLKRQAQSISKDVGRKRMLRKFDRVVTRFLRLKELDSREFVIDLVFASDEFAWRRNDVVDVRVRRSSVVDRLAKIAEEA